MTAVLIAEDDPGQLQGLTAYLRYAGYAVYGAKDGAEAIALAEQLRPDAAICDWNLGAGPDGADVMLKLQSVNPDLVGIFVTGNDVRRLRCRTRDGGKAAAYFAKPIPPQRLLEALKEAGCVP